MQTLKLISSARAKFTSVSKTADTTPPQWQRFSRKANDWVNYGRDDNIKLEEAWTADPTSEVEMGEGGRGHTKYVILLAEMAEVVTGKKKGKVVEKGRKEVRRLAPYTQLLALLEDYTTGVIGLNYHLVSDLICPHTGKPFALNDEESFQQHTAEINQMIAAGTKPERWAPTQVALVSVCVVGAAGLKGPSGRGESCREVSQPSAPSCAGL